MRLTKLATLKDMKDAAALQAWTTADQLTKGDLSEFQRAYFLNELSRAYLTLSIDIVDANDLLTMMAEVQDAPIPPTKKRVPRTKKPPSGAPKAAPKSKTLPPKQLRPRKKKT